MKAKTLLTSMIVLVLLFSVGGSASLAQTPPGGIGGTSPSNMDDVAPAAVDANVGSSIPIQGYLTNNGGTPLNGNYNITATLYDAAAAGNVLCSYLDTISVANGRFNMLVDSCTNDDINGRAVYLGLKVGADAEMTPRQQLFPVPYAFSLRPGAIINNAASGHALELISASNGITSATLSVENNNAAGIAVVAQNDGTDTTLLVQNNGAGPLIKGFGSDGGDDEFRVENNGTIESKAPTYLFIPGDVLIKNLSSDSTRWDIQPNGAARIWRGAVAGAKTVYFPITLPGMLYGQAVKIKSVTVEYVCEDGSVNFIYGTGLNKSTDADSSVPIISDAVYHVSNSASSYTISPTSNNVLGSSDSFLGFYLSINFVDDVHFVQIGGIRLLLGTHELY